MDAKLPSFVGWHFLVSCTPCNVRVQQDVAALCGKHRDRSVAAIVARLRCSRCGAVPALVVLVDGHEAGGCGERQRLWLLLGSLCHCRRVERGCEVACNTCRTPDGPAATPVALSG
jgi:hypothetical protein